MSATAGFVEVRGVRGLGWRKSGAVVKWCGGWGSVGVSGSFGCAQDDRFVVGDRLCGNRRKAEAEGCGINFWGGCREAGKLL